MHVIYIPDTTDFWLQYYKNSVLNNPQYQLGGELPGFRAYSPYHLRGAGLGSFFKSLFRMALPVLKSAGKHALVAGSKIAGDVTQGHDFKESFKKHGKIAAGDVLHETADRIQRGKGLGKRKQMSHSKQLTTANKRKRHVRKLSFNKNPLRRTVGSSKDIFPA